MENMTVTELKKIENFALENEYGKIVFEGETNVLKLNVDECISIENKNICGFPGIDEKDKVYKDQRLNKPATVTLLIQTFKTLIFKIQIAQFSTIILQAIATQTPQIHFLVISEILPIKTIKLQTLLH